QHHLARTRRGHLDQPLADGVGGRPHPRAVPLPGGRGGVPAAGALAIVRSVHRQSVVLGGRRVNFLEHGEGPPVVMLHGLMGSPAYLLPLARAVAATGRRVLLPDLHGHGASDRLVPWSLDAAADDLAAALALAGAERPALPR